MLSLPGWLVAVLVIEYGVMALAAAGLWCHDVPLAQQAPATQDLRVLVLADMQLSGRTWLAARLCDSYLAMASRLLRLLQRPHLVVNLGDVLDRGRANDTAAWQSALARYRALGWRGERVVPGNHDDGLHDSRTAALRERHEAALGASNWLVPHADEIALVGLDSLATRTRADERGALAFAAALRRAGDVCRRRACVVFVHQPLWRSDSAADCGPLRRARDGARALPNVLGDDYATQAAPYHTRRLLNATQPLLVLSGDDHDVCVVTHPPSRHVPRASVELTVPAASWLQGSDWPGYAVLTFGRAAGLRVEVCFLPARYVVWALLGALAALAGAAEGACERDAQAAGAARLAARLALVACVVLVLEQ